MTVRKAVPDDIAAILLMAREFHEAAGLDDIAEFDPDSAMRSALALMSGETTCLLVHTSGGMIAGTVFPQTFNHNVRIAQELFWWVTPEARRTKAGIELLQAFEGWAADNGARMLNMVALEALAPDRVGQLYRHNGYKPLEHGYIKRVN